MHWSDVVCHEGGVLTRKTTFQNIKKDEQLNLLRDANLQLRGQVFDLNQDIVDLLEIIESQKNRRMVSHEHILNRCEFANAGKTIEWRSLGCMPNQILQEGRFGNDVERIGSALPRGGTWVQTR